MKRVTGPALELHPVSRPRGISLRPAGKIPYLRPVWSRGAFGARHRPAGRAALQCARRLPSRSPVRCAYKTLASFARVLPAIAARTRAAPPGEPPAPAK